jgi:hypothetical protein
MFARFTLLFLTLVSLSGSTALARAYEDNDNVSSMKGQLVEVGDRNKYHYDYPRTNLSLNPFGLIMGQYGFSGSYAVTDNIAARGDINYAEAVEGQGSGYELGLSAQIFFKKMYNGIYLEPGIVRMHRDHKTIADYDAFGPQIMLGYTWFWDSGFNVALAMGGGRNWMKSSDYDDASDDVDVDSDDNEAEIETNGRFFGNGYLRVGYAF